MLQYRSMEVRARANTSVAWCGAFPARDAAQGVFIARHCHTIGAEHLTRCREKCHSIEKAPGSLFVRSSVGAKGRNRTGDTSIFSAVLYRLSYLGF